MTIFALMTLAFSGSFAQEHRRTGRLDAWTWGSPKKGRSFGTTWKGVEWKRRGPWMEHRTQDLRGRKRLQWSLRVSCHLPPVASPVLKAVAGICLELLKSHETVPEHPDDQWCGQVFYCCGLQTGFRISLLSLPLPSPVLSCRGWLFIHFAADTLMYSNTSSITVKKKKNPPNLAPCLWGNSVIMR